MRDAQTMEPCAPSAHGIPPERVISRAEGAVELEVHIPATSDYFDGHFPQFKLLPAVAQIDLVTGYARAYFGTSKAVRDIKRCKFIAPLLPDTTVRVALTYTADGDAGMLTFKITGSADGVAYASGTVRI